MPRLADQGIYMASESSFYRVLKEHDQIHCRWQAQLSRKVTAPQAWVAYGPNQVWSWDITYLPSMLRGEFLRLQMVIDVFSRRT